MTKTKHALYAPLQFLFFSICPPLDAQVTRIVESEPRTLANKMAQPVAPDTPPKPLVRLIHKDQILLAVLNRSFPGPVVVEQFLPNYVYRVLAEHGDRGTYSVDRGMLCTKLLTGPEFCRLLFLDRHGVLYSRRLDIELAPMTSFSGYKPGEEGSLVILD